ncbi:hypothetical protein STENM327S_01061 [Streptomyces tendae]
MGLEWWGIACGLVGLVFVWFNKYNVFEKVMTVLVGVMFVVTVYLAIRVTPDLGDAFAGLLPVLPDEKDSVLNTLGLIGGVGGTITLAAYGYWVNAKGWTNTGWMKVMRLDNRVAYATTGIFVVAMLFVGSELLHSANIAIASGDKGLIQLGDILEQEYGTATGKLFLIGFFATSFTSLIGVWHGGSLMFADFLARRRGEREARGDELASGRRERSWAFRAYLLWLTFPPIVLLFQDEPFRLIIIYGVLGAAFMPFLALTLMWLLNSSRTPREWRNGHLSNGMLTVAGLLFLVLCVKQIWDQPWSEFLTTPVLSGTRPCPEGCSSRPSRVSTSRIGLMLENFGHPGQALASLGGNSMRGHDRQSDYDSQAGAVLGTVARSCGRTRPRRRRASRGRRATSRPHAVSDLQNSAGNAAVAASWRGSGSGTGRSRRCSACSRR